MLNMALLNIMGGAGGGGVPDTSRYNIFGLQSPCIYGNENLHYPHTTFIWNKFLTTFTAAVRCDDNDGHACSFGVGARPRICDDTEQVIYLDDRKTNATAGIGTTAIKMISRLRMCYAFVDTQYLYNSAFPDIESGHISPLLATYADYWEHLKPINGRMLNSTTTMLSDYLGGKIWVAGATYSNYNYAGLKLSGFCPVTGRGIIKDGNQQEADNWNMAVVPVRGITSYPKNEFSNSMVYGFMQLEYPQQVGGTLSYSFGVSAQADCYPKHRGLKCGNVGLNVDTIGQFAQTNPPNPLSIFGGFAAFDLDLFLRPFIKAGLLSSYADAKSVYNKLCKLLLNEAQTQEGAPTSVVGSARAYQSHENLWQGIFDNWLEQPYKDIFKELGASEEYYPKWLMTNYPQQANFHSILGCGRSYDAGAAMNAAIYSMMEACAVFKALSTFPDDFPVDLPALVANT